MSGSLHCEGHRGLEKRSMYKTRVREGYSGVDSYIGESGGERDPPCLARLEWDGQGRKSKIGYNDPRRRQEKTVDQIQLELKRATNLSPGMHFRQGIGKESSKGFTERRNGGIDDRKEKLGGLIIMCNKRTKDRILLHEAFEIPLHRKKLLEKVISGLKLFFFEVEDKELSGIFEVTSYDVPDTVRKGVHEDLYSALVRFRVLKICLPLHELDFKDAIRENCYEADNLTIDLHPDQVLKLMRLFQLAEAPRRHSNAGRTTHFTPPISRSGNMIDLQQPCQQLESYPEKYVLEGSQLLAKELLPVASRSINLSNYKSHMYSDTISLSRYLQDPHKTKCMDGSRDGFAFKSSLDALPSPIEYKIRGGASVSSHALFSSNHKPQDVFDERSIEAKSSVNFRSLSLARSGLDLKADVDYWDSTYMTKLDTHANLPSNSERTDAVAYLQKLYPGHLVSVNDCLDERKFDETYTSDLSRRYGYEGRELSRLYGYEGQESCSFGDKSFPTSTGCRSSNSNFVAMIDAQVKNDAPRLGEGGMLKSNASTSLFSSHVHIGDVSSQVLGAGQDVSPADRSLTPHVLRTRQEVSPANLSQITTNYRNYFVDTNETLTTLPLDHVYTPNSKMLKTDMAKRKVALLSNANHSAGRSEEQRKELSHRDEPVFRSSQRGKSWRLTSRPSTQPKKVFKVQGSDTDGHIRIDACRKQSSPSRATRRLSPEDRRKRKRSVWSRISGLERSRESQIFEEDLDLEGLDLSFPVNCKYARGSSDVPDRHKLDVMEELNVDFTFSQNTFLVDFKRRKNKLPANDIDSKDGKGLANGGSCSTGAENMSENQKQKRRKLLRSEVFHQGL